VWAGWQGKKPFESLFTAGTWGSPLYSRRVDVAYALPADTSGVWTEGACKALCEATPGCRSIVWASLVFNCTLYRATCSEVPNQCWYGGENVVEATYDRLSKWAVAVGAGLACGLCRVTCHNRPSVLSLKSARPQLILFVQRSHQHNGDVEVTGALSSACHAVTDFVSIPNSASANYQAVAYFSIAEPMSFADADATCQSLGARLATFTTETQVSAASMGSMCRGGAAC
jgi:hypothetical protein